MLSKPESDNPAIPTVERDGTIRTYLDRPARPLGDGHMVRVRVPRSMNDQIGLGQFFLARSSLVDSAANYSAWSYYGRLPMHTIGVQPGEPLGLPYDCLELCTVATPTELEGWAVSLQPLSGINLLGPLGRELQIREGARTLLVLAPYPLVPIFTMAVQHILDKGGRVTLLTLDSDRSRRDFDVLRHLPLAVEVQELRSLTVDMEQLLSSVRWADIMLIATEADQYGTVRDIIAQARFRLEPDFAYVFVDADMMCGFGACLACSVPTMAGRYTRACVHGPLMDFAHLSK